MVNGDPKVACPLWLQWGSHGGEWIQTTTMVFTGHVSSKYSAKAPAVIAVQCRYGHKQPPLFQLSENTNA